MKLAPVITLAIVCGLMAGCEPRLTLAEAQALCTKQGGLLVVIYSQQVTRSNVGPLIASPGRCVQPNQIEDATLAPVAATAPPPAKPAPAAAK